MLLDRGCIRLPEQPGFGSLRCASHFPTATSSGPSYPSSSGPWCCWWRPLHHCLLQRGYRCAEVFVYECLTDRPAAVLQGGPVNLSVPLAVLAASLRHRRWRPSARRWPSDRDSGTPNTVSAADWTRGEPEGYETNMWFHWNRVNDSIQTCASRSLGLRAVARL